MKVLRIREFGKPTVVPELVEEDPPELAVGQVLVAMQAAPINPSDLLLIRGWYGHRPALPAGLGSEGVGRIVSVGPGVDPGRVGERVMILPTLRHGTWRGQVALPEDEVVPVDPAGDPLQQSMLGVNPVTAHLLLRRFVDLAPGAWVGQVGGTTAVGRYVIALARREGLRTLSVVRRQESAADLLDLGADAVVVEGDGFADQVATALGGDRLSLLLDPIAGGTVAVMLPFLRRGGVVVSYGGMSGASLGLAPADLIFRDLQVRGFWQKHWLDVAPRAEVIAAYAALEPLVADGTLHAPVATTYPLERYEEAMAHALDPGRRGKVLFAW